MFGPKGMPSSSPVEGVRLFGLTALCRKVDQKRKSGLVIPDNAKDARGTANLVEVCLVGDGRFRGKDGAWLTVEPRLAVGDLVVVNPRMIEPLQIEGKVYVLVEEENVLCVLDREMEVM